MKTQRLRGVMPFVPDPKTIVVNAGARIRIPLGPVGGHLDHGQLPSRRVFFICHCSYFYLKLCVVGLCKKDADESKKTNHEFCASPVLSKQHSMKLCMPYPLIDHKFLANGYSHLFSSLVFSSIFNLFSSIF